MKSTGIIRRIDDLGRIIIPKDIRQSMGIHEADPMEIFVEDGCVCFKKYDASDSYLERIGEVLHDLVVDLDVENKEEVCEQLRSAMSSLAKNKK